MRFDDDTEPATMLVRTPPTHAGERLTYEVSDEFVDEAVAAVREVLNEGETPIVGKIQAVNADDAEADADFERAETGDDPLAVAATRMAFQGVEQTTGVRIDESGTYDLPGGEPTEKPKASKPRRAAKKAAARN